MCLRSALGRSFALSIGDEHRKHKGTSMRKTSINQAITMQGSYKNADFHNSIFLSEIPTGVKFSACNFKGCQFPMLYLDENEFTNCVFTHCNFSKSIWNQVKFDNCWFIKCSIEEDYDMSNVFFYDCIIVDTVFDNKPNKLSPLDDDTIKFNKCKITNSLFDQYCLDSSVFRSCVIKGTEFSDCSMNRVEIENTNIVSSNFNKLKISNNKWNSVRFKECIWEDIKLYDYNKFSNVILMETTVKNCEGDFNSLQDLLVSPYRINMDSDFTNIVVKPNTHDTGTLQKAPTQIHKSINSKIPHRYISEGL